MTTNPGLPIISAQISEDKSFAILEIRSGLHTRSFAFSIRLCLSLSFLFSFSVSLGLVAFHTSCGSKVEEATNCMGLSNTSFKGATLTMRRPKDYQAPIPGGFSVSHPGILEGFFSYTCDCRGVGPTPSTSQVFLARSPRSRSVLFSHDPRFTHADG